MANVKDLQLLFDELDERAKSDPRLDRYRVKGRGDQALEAIPAGWFLSDSVAHIVINGGWWPGRWDPVLNQDIDTIEVFLNRGSGLNIEARHRRRFRWHSIGSVWDPDWFCTPLSKQPSSSAPLCGFSAQAHWISMVFPDEASLFKAFIATYDELGFQDDDDDVNPFFVEWVTDPPRSDVPGHPPDPKRLAVHQRLVELAATWSTDHPSWTPGFMPAMKQGHQRWPAKVAASVLGVETDDIHT